MDAHVPWDTFFKITLCRGDENGAGKQKDYLGTRNVSWN